METLLTVDDLATLLKKSVNAIRIMRWQGRLPSAIKIGRSVYWRQHDVEKLLSIGREEQNEAPKTD